MEVIRDTAAGVMPGGLNTAVTVGTFDGLHKGHLKILDQLRMTARENGLRSLVVTFEPHPRYVLQPEVEFGLLTSTRTKVNLLAELGIDFTVVLRFDRTLSRVPPDRFVVDYLLDRYRMKALVVGYDHAFGKDRAGGERVLAELSGSRGFSLTRVPPVLRDGQPVSSSRIRRALDAGDMQEAAALLGRFYSFTGKVVRGAGRGRGLGHPTANLAPLFERKQLFPDGIYAAMLNLDGEMVRGAMHYGPRPTFGENSPTMEINLFDFEGDLYGKVLEVSVVERIRPVLKFDTAGELAAQMDRDDLAVRKVFSTLRQPAGCLGRAV